MAKARPARRPLFTRENLKSPLGVFIEYILAAFIILTAFRFIFPGEEPPLPIFAVSWRFVRGALFFIEAYPALALSAIVAPFGFAVQDEEQGARFLPEFMDRMMQPVITTIVAVVLYGLFFLLVQPVVGNQEESMRLRGQLYGESAGKAQVQAGEGDWVEAGRFVAVCERIWPGSPPLEELRIRIDMELEGSRYTQDGRYWRVEDPASGPNPQNRVPVNAAEALEFAETAFGEARYFDSHWLATLAGRLARAGSPEVAESARMAARAWNAIASLAPTAQERESARIYRLKRSGYEAMVAEDWIRGYYIFKELIGLTPGDPDAEHYLAACEQGALEIAFFADELEMTLGDILTSAVFSIPRGGAGGRSGGRFILRVGSLSTFADYSYGFNIELLVIDETGRLASRMEAPYAKFLPKTLGGERRVVLLLQALDREDRARHWGPTWSGPDREEPGESEAVLNLAYDHFLLMAKIRRGTENLLTPELFTAYRVLEPYGYIPQVFLAEIVSRLAEPVLFLPFAILTLVIGWRYRSRKRQLLVGIPMLILLPLVFYRIFHVYQSMINTLGIWMALSLALVPALTALAVGAVTLFIVTLVLLASQRG
jgi:hypothetical protein